MIQTNQYYPPTGTRVYHTLLLLQSLSPTAPDCLPYSQMQPLCGPCVAFSIFLPQAVSMCNQWTSASLISRIRYCVSGHHHNLKMRIPLCQWGGEEVDKIPIIIRLLKSDGLNKERVSFPGEHNQKTKSSWLVLRVWKEACIIQKFKITRSRRGMADTGYHKPLDIISLLMSYLEMDYGE